MASITPKTALPANGVTSGAVQITGTGCRVSARTTSGNCTLALLRMDNVSGNWFRYTDQDGNEVQLVLEVAGVDDGSQDYSFTLPAPAANEYYTLLIQGGGTFTGVAEIENCSAPSNAGGNVPSTRVLTMGSGLTIGGGASADLSADRTIAIDSTMATLTTSSFTLVAGSSLTLAAGAGGIAAGSGTGATALPTGNLGWVGASNKTISLVGQGASGTVNIDNAATWTLFSSTGLGGTIGRAGQTLSIPSTVTLAADLAMGTHKVTGLSAGSAAGDSLRYEQGGMLRAASNTGTIGAATKYMSPEGGGAVNAAQVILGVVTRTGTLRNLAATLGTAPGGADTVVFTVQKSSDQGATWTDTTLTCTISAAGKTAQDITHFPTVALYDYVAIKMVSSAGTAAAPACGFEIL